MLSSKKLKPYIFLGGILISLFFVIAIVVGHSSASAQGLALPDPTGTGLAEGSLADTILSIINAALAFAGVIVLIVLIYGGYVWMTSGGIPQRIVLAKKILLSAVVGFIVIILSWAIVNFIISGMNGGPGGGGPGGGGPPILPDPSYVFKVIDYSPKGPDIPICRAVQATFDREYQSGSITSGSATGTFHLMKYCTDIAQCNGIGIGLGNCDRSILGITGTFCANDIAGTFITTDPNTVGFKPTNELEKMTDYKVLIDGGASGVQSGSGADCNGAFDICKHWDFKTGDFSDKVPPQVQKVSPVDGADNVCLVKSIAAQFNEEMFKPSLTAAGAFSTTPAHNFSPSAPSFTVMRESPKSPYAANTDYYSLLNADTIMDACFNKLDGNKNATAEGSPTDNYPTTDAGVPVGTTSTWQFKTGETTQCVPKIDAINPADSYYENPGNTLEITGENFDDIADTVIFNKNLAVGTTTAACFNAIITDTDQICMAGWDGVNIPNKITINVPAGEDDSNGAITGPVKVKVGQFQCTGQTTCKDGANKGLNCANDSDCAGFLCGDTGSCDGGVNAGLGCDSNLECSGAESAGVNLNVWSPHINTAGGVNPTSAGAGSYVRIRGIQFGAGAGSAELINGAGTRIPLNLPCGLNSWNNTQVIVEIPLSTALGGYAVQITDSDGRHSNLGSFTVTADPAGPGLCLLTNFCSVAGGTTTYTLTGTRFGAAQGVSAVEFIASGCIGSGCTIFGSATINAWSENSIDITTPVLADGAYDVRVRVGTQYSNSIDYEVPCKGRPDIVLSNACPGSSPNPRPDTIDNCSNLSVVSARFTQDMDDSDLTNAANITLHACNTDASFGGSGTCGAALPGNLSVQVINSASDEVRLAPAAALTQNTWYEFRISGNVRSAGGLSIGANRTYPFHIRDSAEACAVDAIDVVPNSWTMNVLQTRAYKANTLNTATCNTLNPPASGWTWSPIVSSVATVTNTTGNNTDTATGVGTGTENIAAVLDVAGTPYGDSAELTIASGGGGGSTTNKCDSDNDYETENGEECDGADIGSCTGTQECAKRISLCTCQSIPTITATDWCKDTDGDAGKNTGITVKFSTLIDPKSFKIDTGSGGTVSFKQGAAFFSGSLRITNTATNTEVTFYPSAQLGDDLTYDFTIKGGAAGVVSKYGIPLAADSISNFTTGKKLCKIDKVTIILEKDFNPDPDPNIGIGYVPQSYYGPDLFTCAGKNNCPDDINLIADGENQHNAIAESRDANGVLLSNVGITYSWSKSTDAPFTLVDPDANDEDLMVQADPKSGIGALTVKADGGLAGIKTASTNVTVAPCDNPWPGTDYPFRDIYNAVTNPNPTNFSLWYCRDAGAAGTADDLPELEIIPKLGTGELIKELFFYDDANPNDAIGLRVYQNYDDTVSNKQYPWSAREWYEKRAPNKQGAPASTTVDGWEGVQVGRSIYVNAANHLAGASKPKTHIYLMSHSDKISANLKNIYSQLKSNWKFAITEYDDGTDGTSLNPPANSNHMRKLQRDTKRLSDLYDTAVDLYSHQISKGKYPLLPSGSYISGNSTSVWPSWDGALSKEVGAPMPHDPISQMSSLIGWWKMDDDAGNKTLDSGPYNRLGSLSTPILKVGADCKYGNCFEFNGTSDYIDLGSFNGAYSNKLTLAAWIKTKPNVGWDDIVAGGYGNFVFAISDGNLTIGDQGGKTGSGPNIDPIESKRQIDDDKWHFVAATYDGLVVKLYIDGVFEVSGPVNGDFDTNGGNLYIGSTLVNGSEYFDGSIDEVRIWNTPLSDAEINNLFKSNSAKFGSSEDSGWNQTKNAFSCIAGADYDTHIYHYQQESGGADFSLYAALEWVGGDGSTWRQRDPSFTAPNNDPYNPCAGVGSSDCSCYNYRQREVDAANLGLCQNKQWDSKLGEKCDGSVTTGLNGLEGRICPTGKCSGGSDDGKDCKDNLECSSKNCVPNDPTCDVDICEPYCAGGPAVKAVCGNGKIESPVENCECSKICVGGSQPGIACSDDINCPGGGICTFNQSTCGVAKGDMNKYYCYDDGGVPGNDLDAAAIIAGEIDDQFTDTVQCSPTTCNLTCDGAVPILAEVNNGMYEPWAEQCEPARGYCSNDSTFCTIDGDCGVGNYCIALGNGGYYCDKGGAIQCNDGTRGCPTGNTLTSCIGGAVEWNECGGGDFPPKPYNYLNEEINYTDYTAKTGASTVDGLYGWCFR